MRSSATRLTRRDRQHPGRVGKPDRDGRPAPPGGGVRLGQDLLAATVSTAPRLRRRSARGWLDRILVRGDHRGRPQLAGQVELVGHDVDRDDLGGARMTAPEHGGEADPAEPEHRDPVAGSDAAALTTAPTPVSTAQPNSAAIS